ncbi:hypothetical protein P43SY_003248 [Pythium insidiosum]|uniref:RING-type domain-containing protein n=1 Tax=Pythium insidiosum TaxID=114742 RepID=A0AAD5L9J7_PYTIN|nr:hypothetical protein P43SY_003248 [Pythium insidiosum]
MSDTTRGASKAGGRGKPRGRKPKGSGATAPAPAPAVDLLEEKRPARKDSVASSRKDSMLSCLLCCHAIDNVTRFNTVGACGHTGCCSLCALRMRQLLGTTACPFCKADLPRVICIEHEHQSFDSFQDWGDNIGPTHVFDDASGMFFLKSDMARVRRLREPMCPRCDKKLATVAALKTHLQDVHQLQFCGICLEHKKVFLQEQELFTKEQLKAHAAKGNPREGFAGHPRCDFCFSRFYSNTELFDHLHKNHFECDICVRSLGVQNRYYKDYHDLENHFRAEHFLCEESLCLAKKFVVFKTHIDFQAHMATEHPHIKMSRKIDVHFTVKRATDDSGNSGAEQWTAASSDNVINVADFPSLADGGATASQLQFWQGQTVTRPRMEDFPELPTASAPRGGNAVAAATPGFRNALAPPPTPAMLAHMGGAGSSWEYPELAAAAEALGANNPLMRFVKPAKGKKGKKGPRASPSSASQSQSRRSDDAEEKPAAAVAEEVEEEQDSSPGMSKSALVLKIRQVLGSDAKYEVFREACKQYRLAEVDVASFYSKVRGMFPTEEAFSQLFLKLMKLSPDREQVDAVMAHHRQQSGKQTNAAQGFQERKAAKKAERKNRAPPPPSGWASALRQSGLSAPAPIVIPAPQLPQRPSASVWNNSPTARANIAAVSSHELPTSTKITTAPADALAALAISSSMGAASYAQSASTVPSAVAVPPARPTSYKMAKSDFPELPKAGKPIGVQPVTRATWDDQVQAIAQNRTPAAQSKKKNKKKTMTLGELAMQFS